jgi:hypothetical protein
MNRIFVCLSFLLFSVAATSQKVYFIYLQSESGQAFYVKLNDRIHSSSASGYLILSKLRDSTYSFAIGFPANKWPEHNFSVQMNRKDHGFLLKNFGEKGWGLFDLQSLAVQMTVAGSAKIASPGSTDNKDVSAFTEVLSKAADDPSLKEKPAVQPKVEEKKSDPVIAMTEKKPEPVIAAVEKKEEPKIEKTETAPPKPMVAVESITRKEEQPKIIKDTVVDKKTPEVAEQLVTKKEEPVVEVKEQVQEVVTEEKKTEPGPYKRSVVKRRSESSTTEGFGLVFTDELEDGSADTIRLVIPNPKTGLVTLKEEPKEERKFLEIAVPDSAAKPVEIPPVALEKTVVVEPKKNNCPGTADENDFLKVRKRMAGEENDDNMVTEAKKYFKTKCFATLQVKNLGALFLTDEARYKFFDMAYPYVSDLENFSSLGSELKDPYYINRFKAMLR